MKVCMHVCMHWSMYHCTHALMNPCTYAPMHTFIHAPMNPCTHEFMHSQSTSSGYHLSWLYVLKQGPSIAWNSPSSLGWLARKPLTSDSLALRLPIPHNILGFLHRLWGLNLESPWLHGKYFNMFPFLESCVNAPLATFSHQPSKSALVLWLNMNILVWILYRSQLLNPFLPQTLLSTTMQRRRLFFSFASLRSWLPSFTSRTSVWSFQPLTNLGFTCMSILNQHFFSVALVIELRALCVLNKFTTASQYLHLMPALNTQMQAQTPANSEPLANHKQAVLQNEGWKPRVEAPISLYRCIGISPLR